MSSKKIYKTIGLDPEVAARLDDERKRNRRSYGFIVEEELRKRYSIPWMGKEEKQHVN